MLYPHKSELFVWKNDYLGMGGIFSIWSIHSYGLYFVLRVCVCSGWGGGGAYLNRVITGYVIRRRLCITTLNF